MWRFQRFCSKPLNPNEVPLYGVAVTKKTLLDDEKFEIQVEQFVEPWSGSVRLGVTTNVSAYLATIGNAEKDTLKLNRTTMSLNGQKTGIYVHIGEVTVWDTVGILKASDSTLHFYLNGNEKYKGVSDFSKVIYGVVELYGNGCEVSIKNTVSDCDVTFGNIENEATFSDIFEELEILGWSPGELATEATAQVAIKKRPTFSGRPADWNVNTVCDFIWSIPDCAPYAEKFRSEQIDGAALMALDKKDLKEFFEMPLGLAVKICLQLKKLEEKK